MSDFPQVIRIYFLSFSLNTSQCSTDTKESSSVVTQEEDEDEDDELLALR